MIDGLWLGEIQDNFLASQEYWVYGSSIIHQIQKSKEEQNKLGLTQTWGKCEVSGRYDLELGIKGWARDIPITM